MEGTTQDFLDTDQQIEKEKRRGDDQDETGQDHGFPRSRGQFCQDFGNIGSVLGRPDAPALSLRRAATDGNSTGVMVLPGLLILVQAEKFHSLVWARGLTRWRAKSR
jgi:hypothetical protein